MVGLDKNLWKILNSKNNLIWATHSTLRVYYSLGQDPLQPVTKPLANDNRGGGQFQFGMAKKPTETTTDREPTSFFHYSRTVIN
jgi:hypothetical protein